MRPITRRKFISIATAGAAAAYVGAACGGDNPDDPTAIAASDATAASTVAATGAATVDAGVDAGAVGLRWFGQSMFLLTSPGGTTVLLDPFNDIGYTVPPPLNTNAATITHEHPDHNNATLGGTARLLRGLTADGWADIDQTIGDVKITSVRTYHDNSGGSLLGRNAAFIFDVAGMRFAHLGDLGHLLDDAQLAALGAVDVLMVPTGGSFSIGPEEATRVTEQVGPAIVFPMHYQTPAAPQLNSTAEPFLAGKTVERVGSTDIRVARDALPATLTAYVLEYE